MTAQRDPDRLVGAFLEDGPAELSPRLLGAIRDDVHRTDQRASRRPWRMPTMSRPILILVPLAAAVLLAGALVLGGGRPVPTPVPSPAMSAAVVAPTPTPNPDATGSPAPTPTATPAASISAIADGEPWIAFEDPDAHVSLVRQDGSGRHVLVDAADNMQQTPDWSPDGMRLVLTRDFGYTGQLWVVDADGGNGVALTPFNDRCAPLCTFARSPRWSHDGSRIAYIEDRTDAGRFTGTAIVIVDVATGAAHTIYETPGNVLRFPTWSPDDAKLAVQLDRYTDLGADGATPVSATVGIVDLNAANPTPVGIPGLPALAGHPDWNVEGSILFRTNAFIDGAFLDPSAGTTIGVISPDGRDARVVLESPPGGPILRATSWTPDGGRILYAPLGPGGAGGPTLRAVNPDGSGDASLTGEVTTSGGEPRLRPIP